MATTQNHDKVKVKKSGLKLDSRKSEQVLTPVLDTKITQENNILPESTTTTFFLL